MLLEKEISSDVRSEREIMYIISGTILVLLVSEVLLKIYECAFE